ncbi:MAG: enoyl-CoA hydratase/isomerase family protein [Dehalococcoidia bacterium]|nr:MAG: enoyl-CoA hydratase/isomerase family protein [Dehalococcoidia bacterium]
MAYKSLTLEKEGPVAIVTLNRPDAGNSFDFRMMVEFDDVMRVVGEDNDVKAVIITGNGKYFSTGIDLSIFTDAEGLVAKEGGGEEVSPLPDDQTYGKGTIVGGVVRIRNMAKPVIAAINGPVIGASCSMVLACDMRIASDQARFAMVFVKRGIVPDTGGSFTLPRIVGFPKACEMILTGDTIDAAEADRIGLVNRIVPHDELMNAARELAGKIAKNPPLAVQMAKADLYNAMVEMDFIEQLTQEEVSQAKLLNTEDFMEAATAFLEKREPHFKGK